MRTLEEHDALVDYLHTLTPDERRVVLDAATRLGAHDDAAAAVLAALEEVDGPKTVRRSPSEALLRAW